MNTFRNAKMLRVSAVGAAVAVLPAMLFAGGLFAGTETAQAETNPTYFTNPNGTLEVIYGGGGLSLSVTVVDSTNPPGATQDCHYHSVGVMSTPAFPFDTDTWVTGPSPSSPMTILFPSHGGTYSVTVTCYGTGNSASYSPVVF